MATTSLTVKVTHPRRDFDGITQLGLKALGLEQAHQAEVDPRLPLGLIAGLSTDLTALGVAVPACTQAHTEAQISTETRDAAVERIVRIAGAMRSAVRDANAPAEVQHAYGVGKDLDKRRATVVKAVAGLILDRLAAHPEDVAAFGFAQTDIDELTTARADLQATSKVQQQKRAGAPLTTRDRNQIANRILAAVKRIRGAGVLAFAADSVVRAEFAALQLGPGKKGAKPTEPAQPATPVSAAPSQPAAPAAPATPPSP